MAIGSLNENQVEPTNRGVLWTSVFNIEIRIGLMNMNTRIASVGPVAGVEAAKDANHRHARKRSVIKLTRRCFNNSGVDISYSYPEFRHYHYDAEWFMSNAEERMLGRSLTHQDNSSNHRT